MILLLDRRAALVEVARRRGRPANKVGLPDAWSDMNLRDSSMKDTTKSCGLSVGEIVWVLVTIGSLIALFRCLAR